MASGEAVLWRGRLPANLVAPESPVAQVDAAALRLVSGGREPLPMLPHMALEEGAASAAERGCARVARLLVLYALLHLLGSRSEKVQIGAEMTAVVPGGMLFRAKLLSSCLVMSGNMGSHVWQGRHSTAGYCLSKE